MRVLLDLIPGTGNFLSCHLQLQPAEPLTGCLITEDHWTLVGMRV